MQPSTKKYRQDIQLLRGLAVLAVVLFHAYEGYFDSGYLGVDVFFVISGFVVTPLILNIFINTSTNSKLLANLKNFFIRRIYRLAPALLVVLMFSVILIILLIGPEEDHRRFARQGFLSWLILGNLGAYRYSGDYFSSNPNPLIHTWSLSVEEQIYIFIPLLVFFLIRKSKNAEKQLFKIFTIITIVSFTFLMFPKILEPVYSFIGSNYQVESFAFYSPLNRIWQFTLGGIVYLTATKNDQRQFKQLNFALNFIVVIILFLQFRYFIEQGSILASLSAALVLKFQSLNSISGLVAKILRWLGDRSYSIYLIHMPILYVMKFSRVISDSSPNHRNLQVGLGLLLTFILGSFSYSKVELVYRKKMGLTTETYRHKKAILFLIFLFPLAIFATMDIGNSRQYWGMSSKPEQPEHAGEGLKCFRNRILDPPCVFGDKNSNKNLILIGDSHAGHISEVVVESGIKFGWGVTVWTIPGCPVQMFQTPKGKVTEKCLAENKKRLEWISENKIDLVLVSQYVKEDSSQEDLQNALQLLRNEVPKILLIENNPVFPDELDFLIRRPLLMRPYVPPKFFLESEMNQAPKIASDKLAAWARQNKIETFSSYSIFCKNAICTRYSEKKGWLYWDSNHFSVSGASLTKLRIEEFLSSQK